MLLSHSIKEPGPLWSALTQGPAWPPALAPPRAPGNSHSLPEAELDASLSAPEPLTCLGANSVLLKPGSAHGTQVQTPPASIRQQSPAFYMQMMTQWNWAGGFTPPLPSADSGPHSVPAWLPTPPHHDSLLGIGLVCVPCPRQDAEHCSWYADNLGTSLNPPAGSRMQLPTKSCTPPPRGTQAALWGLTCPRKWMVGDLTLLTGSCAGGGRTQAPGGSAFWADCIPVLNTWQGCPRQDL